MTEQIFDGIEKTDACGWKWQGKCTISFGRTSDAADLLIQGAEQDGITARQKNALHRFLEKWPELRRQLIDALITYYNQEERFSYGPDDETEAAEWWPEIETEEALLDAVALEALVVPDDFMMEDSRRIYLLFSRTWGGTDLDDNGIGVCCINEMIDEIAYKDIAF